MGLFVESQGPIKFASFAASSSGNNSVISAVTSKQIRVLSYVVVATSAVTLKFCSGTSGPTDLTGAMPLGANGGVSAAFSPAGWFETASGAALSVTLGGAVAVAGHITYQEV